MKKTDSALCQDLISSILQKKPKQINELFPKIKLEEFENKVKHFKKQRQLLRSDNTEVLQMGRTNEVL